MRTFVVALLIVTAPALASAHTQSAPWCLPPVFDGGERLHGLPGPSVYWLELLLRQHELCWRRVPGEVRILLAGSSSVFGFPFPADRTFAHRINQQFDASAFPAHVFNLAFVNPYQLRDAIIINEARRFAPDIILYPVTLAEFRHAAPVLWPPVIRFFDVNRQAVANLAGDAPPGLDEPLRRYQRVLTRPNARSAALEYVRESGSFIRSGARLHARSLATAIGGSLPPLANTSPPRSGRYNCAETRAVMTRQFSNWEDWTILPYLDELRQRDGVEVVLVSWPIAHEPIDDCYNVRNTDAAVGEFSAWMREQTAARNLPYVDLHTLLAPEYFLDSLHVSAEGHTRVAEALADALEPIVIDRLRRCEQTGTGCGQ